MGVSITHTVFRTLQRTAQGRPELLLALPTPATANWNEQVEQAIYKRKNSIGDLITDELMVNSREPIISLEYPRATKELYSLKLGFELENQASTGEQFSQTFRVRNNLTVDAKATGVFGNGVLADTGDASYLLDGRSTPMTQVAIAPANAGEYQILADGQLLFNSTEANALVTVTAPVDLASVDFIGENPFDIFEFWLYFVIQDRGIRQAASLHFGNAQINRQESSEFDFQAETFGFQLNSLDDNCVPDLRFYNQLAVC